MACVFSGGVMRAREVQQPCQLRFENVLENALANRRVNVRVKTAGMMSRGEQGHLRIGFYSSLADGFLPTLLHCYQRRRPQVDVRLTEGTSQGNIALLRQNELDIAFVVGEPALEDCHSRPFWHERLLFALPQDHPLTASQAIAWEASHAGGIRVLSPLRFPRCFDPTRRQTFPECAF